MRVILGLVARADNGSTPEDRTAIIDRTLRQAKIFISYAFPAQVKDLSLEVWRSVDGGIALLTWHNEKRIAPELTQASEPTGAVALVGYTGETLNITEILRAGDLLNYSSILSGCFGLYRADHRGIEAVTDVTRSNGVYYAESTSLRIVSSRALLTHLIHQGDITGSDDPSLDMNLVGIRHMALGGQFIADQTPFLGTVALTTAELIRIDPWFTHRKELPALAPDVQDFGDREMPSLVRDIATALVKAFDPIAGTDLNLALTGGRDSRLLAAALMHRPDINVRSATTGMDDDPDVIIAKMLSNSMGVTHVTNPWRGVMDSSLILAEEPLSRIIRALDVHDAMTSGWDDIEDYGEMKKTHSLSGVGGEIMRGGLVWTDLDTLNSEVAVQRLTAMLTGGGFFAQQYNESADALVHPIIHMAHNDFHRAIDDFYYTHRNGRWVSARRAGARFRTRVYDPLLDNRFVRLIRSVPAEIRWKERLAFDVLTELAPSMRDIPLEGNRWRFERQAPANGVSNDERNGWEKRYSITRSEKTASYSWQRLENKTVRARVRDLILDGMSGPAGSLFDRHLIEQYLKPAKYRYPSVVWNIATAVVMLSLPWYKTSRPQRTLPIEIRLTK